MIINLQSIRGICAMTIIIHHLGFSFMEPAGVWSVAMFAMLSGFVLSIAFERRAAQDKLPTVGSFMKKRLRRIYPLYLIGVVWALMLMKFQTTPAIIAANLLMIQSWVPDPAVYFAVNAPAWFVSGLILRYLLFIPAIAFMCRRPRRFMTATLILAVAYFSCAFLLPESLVEPIVYIFPPMQILIFAVGMIGFRILSAGKYAITSVRKANIAAAALIILLAAQFIAYPHVTERLTSSSYWWPATLLLILLLSMTDRIPCLLTGILHIRPLRTLGAISYPLYILHLPFITTYRIILNKTGLTLSAPAEAILCLLLFIPFCILAARLTNPRRKHSERQD